MARTRTQANDSPEHLVLHGGIGGQYWQGQVITRAEHFPDLDDAGWQRLLDLGAIAPVGSDAARDAEKAGLPETTPDGQATEDPPKKPGE